MEAGYMGSDQIYRQMSAHLKRSRKLKPIRCCKSKRRAAKVAAEAEAGRIP